MTVLPVSGIALGPGYSAHEEAAIALLLGYRHRGRPLLATRLRDLGVLTRTDDGLQRFATIWFADPALAMSSLERAGDLPRSAVVVVETALALASATPVEIVLSEHNAAVYGAALWRLADAFDARRS